MRFAPALALAALTSLAAPLAARANDTPGPTTLEGIQPALPTCPDIGPKSAIKVYELPAQRFQIQLGAPQVQRRYTAYAVSFPSPVQKRWPTIYGNFFMPNDVPAGQRVPAAVVVHHLGGSFEAEEVLAKHLATNGVAAVFISLPNYGKRQEPKTKQGFLSKDPIMAFQTFQQAVLDVIRAGDFLRAQPGVDPGRVGVVGVSLGAFVSAVARGVDVRFRRSVFVLGGGDLANMFAEIPEARNLLEHTGIKAEEIRPVLGPLVAPVDPLTFADRINPADVLMLNALQDEIVPVRATQRFWRALGKPRIRWFDCGHYGLALHLPTVFNLALDHLKGRSAF
ncbi:MAG: alpha/beta hydrolase family protein [Planctomycetota bacterium]